MGCGKSTAARLFEELGWKRLDADEIVRNRLLTDSLVVGLLVERWGPEVAGAEGVNRAAVARRVFNDDGERLWLESVLHPRLTAYWREVFAANPEGPWVVEVPLLFEKGLENWFDLVACVAASSAPQIARLEERGMSQALAEQRISKQLPLAQKCDLADVVLSNDGSRDFLRAQVEHLHRRLLSPV